MAAVADGVYAQCSFCVRRNLHVRSTEYVTNERFVLVCIGQPCTPVWHNTQPSSLLFWTPQRRRSLPGWLIPSPSGLHCWRLEMDDWQIQTNLSQNCGGWLAPNEFWPGNGGKASCWFKCLKGIAFFKKTRFKPAERHLTYGSHRHRWTRPSSTPATQAGTRFIPSRDERLSWPWCWL